MSPKPPPTPHALLVQDWHKAWLHHRGGKPMYGFPAKDFVLMEEMLTRAKYDPNLVRACIQLLLTSDKPAALENASVGYMHQHFDALMARVLGDPTPKYELSVLADDFPS